VSAINGELKFALPPSVSGRMQLARLVRELESLENEFETQKAQDREAKPRIPAMSQGMADCVELNAVNIMSGQARMQLKKTLNLAKEKAPTIHFTFAVEADPRSIQQLVAYVRKEIHPMALISVGMQPSLVGGAFVRTPNQLHDFSLRALLKGKRNVITDALAKGVDDLQKTMGKVEAVPVAPAPQETPVAASAASRLVAAVSARQATASPTGWPERRPVQQPATRQPLEAAPMARSSNG
jgi:hypothetical protein